MPEEQNGTCNLKDGRPKQLQKLCWTHLFTKKTDLISVAPSRTISVGATHGINSSLINIDDFNIGNVPALMCKKGKVHSQVTRNK